MNTTIRAFFAIDLPESSKKNIASHIHFLKKQIDFVRWIKPDHLHITLQFIAQFASKDIIEIIDQIKKKLWSLSFQPFYLELGFLEWFPIEKPKVIAFSLLTAQDELIHLSQIFRDTLKCMNYPSDLRVFRAHLTLGYLIQPKMDLKDMTHFSLKEKMWINKIVLFESKPTPKGSCYIPIAIIPL